MTNKPQTEEALEEENMKIELIEFAYEKYGQHTVAVKTEQGFNLELFDACKIFAENNSMKEYKRVKNEAAEFAKYIVEAVNKHDQPDPRLKHYEELVEGLKFTNALTIAAIKGYSESNDDKLEMHLRGIRKHLKQILKQIEENNASSLCG